MLSHLILKVMSHIAIRIPSGICFPSCESKLVLGSYYDEYLTKIEMGNLDLFWDYCLYKKYQLRI